MTELEQRVGRLLRRKKALWDYTVPVAEVAALVEADVRERVARDLGAQPEIACSAHPTGPIQPCAGCIAAIFGEAERQAAIRIARNGAST